MTATAAPPFGLPGRIQAPNSKRRAIAVLGLGRGGAGVAERLRANGPPGLQVYDATRPGSGDDLAMLPIVHRLAAETHTQLMALYLVAPGGARAADDEALAALRRAAHMLVVSSDESYIEAMVAALCGAEQEIPE